MESDATRALMALRRIGALRGGAPIAVAGAPDFAYSNGLEASDRR
jgi:hypothetical protein